MKKTIAILLLIILAFSCKDDDEIILPPKISNIENEYVIEVGQDLILTPKILEAEDVVYSWVVDGKQVASNNKYVFTASVTGNYIIILKVNNKGGSDQKKITVKVKDKDTAPLVSNLEGEYTVEVDSLLSLEPTVSSTTTVNYTWSLNKKKVAESKKYIFNATKAGNYSIRFKASNKFGSTEREIIIKVVEKMLAPSISNLDEKYKIEKGSEIILKPLVISNIPVTYSWILNEEEVSKEKNYSLNFSKAGIYNLTFKAKNNVGESSFKMIILVEEELSVSVSACSILSLNTPDYMDETKQIEWKMLTASSSLYRFTSIGKDHCFVSAVSGVYTVEITDGEISSRINISVSNPGNKLSPYTAKVFDYNPAPGQFVNKLPEYNEGDTYEDMVEKAAYWLVGEDAYMVTLGGWGGSVTIGFDHTIVNVEGKCDFRIRANAFGANDNGRPNAPFGGSCEPGIILVSYDKNKNGKPDDKWYEISGSSNFSSENENFYSIGKESGNDMNVIRDYEMTYYKPIKEKPDNSKDSLHDNKSYVLIEDYLRWTDNQGNEGYKIKNIYHDKNSYYPGWIKGDQLTFSGIRLPENGVNEYQFNPDINEVGMYYVLYAFKYGYVDNYPNNSERSAIDINWAVDEDGNKVTLPGIDFVKIYNGVNQENGWLGEASTEVEGGEDLHLLGEDINTFK